MRKNEKETKRERERIGGRGKMTERSGRGDKFRKCVQTGEK